MSFGRNYTKKERDLIYEKVKELKNKYNLPQVVIAERLGINESVVGRLLMEKEGNMKLYSKSIGLTEKECEYLRDLWECEGGDIVGGIVKKIDKAKLIPVKSHKE